MSRTAILRLAIKAITHYAQEHFGWSAKYHPEELEKYNALMTAIEIIEEIIAEGKQGGVRCVRDLE